MASLLERTISIIFEGDDRTQAAFKSVADNVSDFKSVVEGTADKLAVVADGVLKVDAALGTLAVGGLAYAYSKSVEFESATVELQKVLGVDQVEALGAAQRAALELSDKYGIASTDILLSIADFKQAGFELEDAMTLTANAMDLVIAGGVDAAQSSEILIAALKGFDLPATEAARLIDILNETSNQYATDVEQLANGMAALSPIAKTMGFSMEETAGILTPVIEIFRSGDEAANALKTGLLKLIDDSKPVRDALESIGVSQTDANGALRSGKDILYDVSVAFQSLDEEQKLFITQQLVGIEQSARMVQVFDNLGKSTEITSTAMGAAGSAAAEVAARLASAEVQIDRFKVGFENLAIVVGDQFRLATTEAISGATDIENALRQMVDDGTFKPVFDLINDFATDLGNWLKGVADAMPEAFEGIDWSGFTGSLIDLREAFGTVFDGLDLTKPEDLKVAIQNVIDAASGFIRVTEGMVTAFAPYVKEVGDFLVAMANADRETLRLTGEILATAKLVSTAGLEVTLALKAMAESGAEWGPVLSKVADAVKLAWDGLAVALTGSAYLAVQAVQAVIQTMQLLGIGSEEDLAKAEAAARRFAEAMEQKFVSAAFDASDAISGLTFGLVGMEKGSDEAVAAMASLSGGLGDTEQKMEATGRKADDLTASLELIPAHKQTDYTADGIDTAKQGVVDLGAELELIPAHKSTTVEADTNEASLKAAQDGVEAAIPDSRTVSVKVEVDEGVLRASKDAVESLYPALQALSDAATSKTVKVTATTENFGPTIEAANALDSSHTATVRAQADSGSVADARAAMELAGTQIEWQAKLDIAEIENQTDLAIEGLEAVQTALEWKAKVDMAELEYAAEAVKAIGSALESAFSSSADIISGAFGVLGDLDPNSLEDWMTGSKLWDVINAELALRERAMAATEALAQAQIDFMRAKMDAMAQGEGLIQIDGAGLQPHLEAFMWEVLAAIQTRVNEEGHAMLFGI